MKKSFWVVLFASLMLIKSAMSAEIEQIPPELAARLAPQLVDQASKGEPAKVKIDADVQKATGFHFPEKFGALVVPQKGLKESEQLAAQFKTDLGAPIGYLFLFNLVPIVDGKKVDLNRLRTVTLETEDGKSHKVQAFAIAVRQLSDEDYRLHLYGTEDKPIVDSRFAEGTGPGPEPLAIEVKDANHEKKEGKIVVTAFGKYQAGFAAAYTGE